MSVHGAITRINGITQKVYSVGQKLMNLGLTSAKEVSKTRCQSATSPYAKQPHQPQTSWCTRARFLAGAMGALLVYMGGAFVACAQGRTCLGHVQRLLVFGFVHTLTRGGFVHKLEISRSESDAFRQLNFGCRLSYCEKKSASVSGCVPLSSFCFKLFG